MKTYYNLTYTNMDGRIDTRKFQDLEEAKKWYIGYKKMNDKNLKLVKIEETELVL
jgi:hypothetical protein